MAPKISTPVSTSSVSAANIFGVSVRKLASRMREASPVSRPAAPATISAVTAPIRLRPPEIFSPARKYGSAEGVRSRASRCQGVARYRRKRSRRLASVARRPTTVLDRMGKNATIHAHSSSAAAVLST